jgi:hypothetical protein
VESEGQVEEWKGGDELNRKWLDWRGEVDDSSRKSFACVVSQFGPSLVSWRGTRQEDRKHG